MSKGWPSGIDVAEIESLYTLPEGRLAIAKLGVLSSMDQCHTMSKHFAMEVVAYGTIRASRIVSGSENHG